MVIYDPNTWTCNNGIFKQRVHKAHSIGAKAALGNCLPYNLDTANKLPTTSVLTKPAGGKEINFNARAHRAGTRCMTIFVACCIIIIMIIIIIKE